MMLGKRKLPLRFSLRTLLLLVLVAALWMGRQAHWIGQRRELQQKHQALAAEMKNFHRRSIFWIEQQEVCETALQLPRSNVSAPGLLWLFGESAVELLHLHFTVDSAEQMLNFDDPEIDRARQLFPEAFIVRSVHASSRRLPAP